MAGGGTQNRGLPLVVGVVVAVVANTVASPSGASTDIDWVAIPGNRYEQGCPDRTTAL